MSIKYLKQIKGTAAPVRVDTKPSFGLYTKTSATDNREVYQDGEWYSTSGGELVTNGTFDTNVTGWDSRNSSVLTFENNSIRIENPAGSTSFGGASQTITGLTVGESYIFSLKFFAGLPTSGNAALMRVYDSTATAIIAATGWLQGDASGVYDLSFIAEETTQIIWLLIKADAGNYCHLDDITVFKTAPTLSATPLPPQSYIEDETGQLAEFEVIDGNVVDVHKAGYVPAIVENGGKFKEVEADEYKGKNACTAWVKYDDTTTPITIVDSYNVRSVVRVSSAVHDVYFTTKMDVAYSAVSNSHDWDTDSVCRETDLDSVRINVRNNSTNAAAPGRVVSVQVFGGKS